MDDWNAWNIRLQQARGVTFDLPDETECHVLDDHARDTRERVVLATGTRVRYVETRYDAVRLEWCFHTVEVITGPAAGSWVSFDGTVGPSRLPWEQ